MTSFRKTALVGGLLYLITFIGSIPAGFLVLPALDPGYVTGAGSETQVRLALVLELVNVIACLGCGIAFFSIVRRVHEGLAVGYLASRLFEAATITVGVLALLALTNLRQQGAIAGNAAELTPVAGALVGVRDSAMMIGPNMAAFNALMLGTALYRARLVPRWLPALGIAGAPLMVAFVVGSILGVTGPGTVFQGIAVLPFFAWELILGLWLTFKGFNQDAPIAVADRAARQAAVAGTSSRVAVATEAGAA